MESFGLGAEEVNSRPAVFVEVRVKHRLDNLAGIVLEFGVVKRLPDCIQFLASAVLPTTIWERVSASNLALIDTEHLSLVCTVLDSGSAVLEPIGGVMRTNDCAEDLQLDKQLDIGAVLQIHKLPNNTVLTGDSGVLNFGHVGILHWLRWNSKYPLTVLE